MRSLTVIIILALCLAVQARHYSDRTENEKRSDDDQSDNEPSRNYRSGQMRHRRKRWQMNYGYDYPPPNPYYPERRDYDRNQELIPQIWRLLDEISAYVRRPPPPPVMPQPIYVPYPVPYPYPVPQNCPCNIQVGGQPNVTKRFPELEDVNQNWGMVDANEQPREVDDGTDGSRPISFEPIKPITPMQRPPPPVEHGSSQATEQKEERVPPPSKSAGTCNAAVLTCCSEVKQQQKACFTGLGCSMTFSKGSACSKQSIAAALESFRSAYSPSIL